MNTERTRQVPLDERSQLTPPLPSPQIQLTQMEEETICSQEFEDLWEMPLFGEEIILSSQEHPVPEEGHIPALETEEPRPDFPEEPREEEQHTSLVFLPAMPEIENFEHFKHGPTATDSGPSSAAGSNVASAEHPFQLPDAGYERIQEYAPSDSMVLLPCTSSAQSIFSSLPAHDDATGKMINIPVYRLREIKAPMYKDEPLFPKKGQLALCNPAKHPGPCKFHIKASLLAPPPSSKKQKSSWTTHAIQWSSSDNTMGQQSIAPTPCSTANQTNEAQGSHLPARAMAELVAPTCGSIAHGAAQEVPGTRRRGRPSTRRTKGSRKVQDVLPPNPPKDF